MQTPKAFKQLAVMQEAHSWSTHDRPGVGFLLRFYACLPIKSYGAKR